MCYSAQIEQSYAKYVRQFGADIDLAAFRKLYYDNAIDPKLRTPKAMDAWFAAAGALQDDAIRASIAQRNATQATRLEQDLFKQRKRLADAERILAAKTTRKAQEDRRIATDKIAWSLGKLGDLKRSQLVDEDARIFPGWYAPVILVEDGRRIVRPMRYQCRIAGAPASNDVKFPGTYNARRDNLDGFWRRQFGATHGLMLANAFFENVALHAMQHRELAPGESEQNVVLEFRPQPRQDMLVACLFSHWQGRDGESLWSFAAITDEPPAEVAAAGHDRCIIPISEGNVDAWLTPQGRDRASLQAILDDRARPYYEHRLAA